MDVLSNLEPKEVFHYFEEVCKIPHPSYKEKKLSDYCISFAKERNLECYQDEMGNAVIIKEAAEGYEDVEPVILQAHLDMVCEKEKDCPIDFDTEGLKLELKGDYISANGTSLGGDDGIGIAFCLAILDSDSIPHPRLEVVFTVCEEVGMEGAAAIDLSMLKGHNVLNLDSEEEGYLLTSCAGGARVDILLPVCREKKQGICYELKIEGLNGGHSGVDIDKGRANANLLMGRMIRELDRQVDFSLFSFWGGQKDNVIPREAEANMCVAEKDAELFEKAVSECGRILCNEYRVTEPGLCISVLRRQEREADVITKEALRKAVLLINLLPNGVQTMSADIRGLVETSLNLGVMSLEEEALKLRYAVRSSVQTAKEYLTDKMMLLARWAGAECRVECDYPAWEYRRNSAFRDTMVRIYKEMYGQEPVIHAVHAGVECGLLAGKIKNMDAVSIGPDIVGIHATEEKLSVSSVKRVWEYVLEIIKQK